MTANEVYVDPSALSRLYIHQAGSREMAAWRAKVSGTLSVTHHGRTEVVNAVCRAAFSGQIDERGMAGALADFGGDFSAGHLVQADILWRAALNRAAELSQNHTPKLGTRSLDVLHVACAVELRCRYFLTFDVRQQELAAAVGLKTVRMKV
ncbi:MAG TPA: type II toxin-antitoxin system VapC family toxin [Verrucomicrobiae bacterium]|jgi:predicted nucleic acid-binding protein|nr:type II toxin-antitoxin system VapC family toxin [Verrucomicrobiae bacterium]